MGICNDCGYPHKGQCDNPACTSNPNLTAERRASILDAQKKRAEDEADREMLRRARENASRRTLTHLEWK